MHCDGKKCCPVSKTSEIICSKWTTLIVKELLVSPRSFSDIEKSLVNITPKILTTRLEFLILHNIVKKKKCDTKKSIYTLTTFGKKLEKVIKSMNDFGKNIK